MAQAVLNRIGQLGLGLAVAGGVVNQALYNGPPFELREEGRRGEEHVQWTGASGR